MKKLILFSFLLLSISCFGESDIEMLKDSFPTYQGVIKMDGKTSKQIYSSLKEWIAINFKSASDVIKLDDPENGQIIVKGTHNYSYNRTIQLSDHTSMVVMSYVFYYNTIFDIKDNKFRSTIEITDIIDNRDGLSMAGYINSMSENAYYKKIIEGAYNLKISLLSKIAGLKEQKQDNW